MISRALPLCLLLVLLATVPAAGSEIRLIDGATGASRVFARSSDFPGEDPRLVRWTDDGASLLLLEVGSVQRLGVDTGSIEDVPAFDFALSVGPGGRFVESARSSPKHARIRLRAPNRRSLGTYDLGAGNYGMSIAWSADGSRVAVAETPALLGESPTLLVLDTATGAVILRRRAGHGELDAQAFAPDASALLVTDGKRLLRVALPSGKATVLFRIDKRDDDQPRAAWGQSGRIAVRTRERLRVLGDPSVDVAMGPDSPSFMRWNPAGTELTYAFDTANGDCSPPQGLGVVVPGQPPRVLVPTSDRKLRALAWSPVGGTLAVEFAMKPAVAREHRGKRGRWPATVGRDYEMATRRGNATVREVLLRASRGLRAGAGREETLLGVRNDLNRLDSRFDEVTDSEVENAVADELDRWLRAAGWDIVDATSEVTCPFPDGLY